MKQGGDRGGRGGALAETQMIKRRTEIDVIEIIKKKRRKKTKDSLGHLSLFG